MIVLFIPLILGGVLFATQVQQIEADVLETNRNNLELNKSIIEGTIRNIDSFISNVRQERSFTDILFLDHPVPRIRTMEVVRAYDESLLSRLEDPYVMDVIVYFVNPQIIFTQQDVFLYPERFYPSFFAKPGLSYEQWVADMSGGEYVKQAITPHTVIYNGQEREVVSIRYSLPLYPRTESQGTLVALVDRARIEALMAEMLLPSVGFAFIQAPDGTILANTASPGFETLPPFPAPTDDAGIAYRDVNGQSMAVSYVRSEYNNWVYVAAVPKDLFLRQAQRIQTLFIIIGIVVLIVGVPVAVFLAYGSSRPIIRVSEILKDGVILSERVDKDPLRFISESVSELISRNSDLRDLLEEQKPLVRSVVVERLFRGEFVSEEELRAFLEHFNLNIQGAFYGVASAFIDGYYDEVNGDILKEFLIKNTVIREQLHRLLPERTLIHDVSLNRIGIVVVFPNGSEDACRRAFNELLTAVSRQVNAQEDIRCIFAHGGVVTRLMEISEALGASMEQLNRTPTDSIRHEIVSEADTAADPAYYYPPELESRIINQTVAGQSAEVELLAATVIEENLKKRHLSIRMLKTLAGEIEGTRIKVFSRLSYDPPEADENPSSERSMRDKIRSLLHSFVDLASTIGDRETQHHRFRRPIIEYLDENYRDPEMSLKKLALEFNLSEVYLSSLFKEMMGVNFYSYLEDLRMKDALELLKTTDYTVDHVASDIGYNSSHVFRRAFKRKFGVSPSGARA